MTVVKVGALHEGKAVVRERLLDRIYHTRQVSVLRFEKRIGAVFVRCAHSALRFREGRRKFVDLF